MAEQNSGALGSDELILRFREAEKRRSIARRTISLTLMLTVLSFIFMMWGEVNYFLDQGVYKFTAALNAEATHYAPKAYRKTMNMVDRLIPTYIDAFGQVYARNEPKYNQLLVDEYMKIDAYSKEKWPDIETAIAELVVEQEATMHEELSKILTDEDISAVSLAYKKALEDYLASLFKAQFEQQIASGEGIVSNLQQLAELEPELANADTQYIFGMLMELLGITMQDNTTTGNIF